MAAVVIYMVALAVVLIQRPLDWAAYAFMILAAELAALFFYIPAWKKLISAQLIVENTIIHIESAVLFGGGEEAEENPCEAIGVYVSVFGILLEDKFIKWGQDGGCSGRLKAVEIGRGYLSIDYHTEMGTQNIKLLYPRPDGDSLAGIIERFRYETGIVQVVKE